MSKSEEGGTEGDILRVSGREGGKEKEKGGDGGTEEGGTE